MDQDATWIKMQWGSSCKMRRGSRCNVDQDDCGGLLRLKSRNHEPLVKFTVSSQSASSFINTLNLLLSWWDGWMISKWKIQNRETSLVFIHAYYNVRLYLLMFPRKGRNWSHCNGLIFTNEFTVHAVWCYLHIFHILQQQNVMNAESLMVPRVSFSLMTLFLEQCWSLHVLHVLTCQQNAVNAERQVVPVVTHSWIVCSRSWNCTRLSSMIRNRVQGDNSGTFNLILIIPSFKLFFSNDLDYQYFWYLNQKT